MKPAELIKISRKCGDRSINCQKECPFYSYDANCITRLLNALADELEKRTLVIKVKKNEK